jgi:hypothetical protein
MITNHQSSTTVSYEMLAEGAILVALNARTKSIENAAYSAYLYWDKLARKTKDRDKTPGV